MNVETVHGTVAAYPAGQRLRCELCGFELEILRACPCQPPDQVFRCCGRDLAPGSAPPRRDG